MLLCNCAEITLDLILDISRGISLANLCFLMFGSFITCVNQFQASPDI